MKFAKSYISEIRALGDDLVRFTMSTPEVDRMSDVVEQSWDLSAFNKSPVALFNHDHSLPIGKWHNVKIVGGNLTGDIEFMPEEISPFAASIGRMVKAGFLKACSVGFRPGEAKPAKSGGYSFSKNELLECSIVSVPANASALAFAKSFGARSNEISRMFVASQNDLRVRQALARHKSVLAKYVD